MLKMKIQRPAIAMLELIFALVIMGIVLMSAPQLISTASKSGFVAIQQEGINEAATKINMIMGYHWDENSADEDFLDPILGTNPGNADLNKVGATERRIGTPIESWRSFIRSDNSNLNASTTLGSDGTEAFENDMDDFNGVASLQLIETSTSDYVEDNTTININTTVAYISDNLNPTSGSYNQSSITFYPFISPTGTTTNIKSIVTTLTSSSTADELSKQIILRAFSCNIGGYKLEERDF